MTASTSVTNRHKPKVRSGCLTCKQRKIKCDEAKPFCGRCTRSHRQCLGYAVPKAWLFEFEASREERRRFEFFIQQTIPTAEVCTDSDYHFWSRIVLQASHSQSSVKHALLSLQAYHESLTDVQNASAHQKYAQLQYNKVLRTAASTQSAPATTITDMLLISIILRSLEVHRNAYDNAHIHLRASRSILDDARKSRVRSSLVDEVLAPMIGRLEFKSNLTPTIKDIEVGAADDEDDIEKARGRGHAIMSWICHNLVHMYYADTYTGLDRVREHVLPVLKGYYHQVDSIMESEARFGRSLGNSIYAKIQYYLVVISLTMLKSTEETVTDLECDHFRALMRLCEEFEEAADDRSPRKTPSGTGCPEIRLAFGVEMVVTAFFVATRCRDPSIRRRAVKFLCSSYRREVRWDSFHAAAISKFVLEQEEQGLHVTFCTDVTENHRLHLTSITYYYETRGVKMSQNPDSANLFERPQWARVSYTNGSCRSSVRQTWIELSQPGSLLPASSNLSCSQRPDRELALSFKVDEPLMPSMAAMVVIAYHKGVGNKEVHQE